MFLTPEELADLTDAPRAKDQITWLDENGYRGLYAIGKKGRVKVLRSVVEARMGGVVSGETSKEPNWGALHGSPQARA